VLVGDASPQHHHPRATEERLTVALVVGNLAEPSMGW
jgi:hypothetical protein